MACAASRYLNNTGRVSDQDTQVHGDLPADHLAGVHVDDERRSVELVIFDG
jgi:hypothetical protein